MIIQILWALVVCTGGLSAFELPKEVDEHVREVFKKGEFLPFKMKVPEGFVLMPLKRDGELGLKEWCAYGEESVIEDLWEQIAKNPQCVMKPRKGLFRMRLSEFVQKNEKEFSKTDKEIIQNVKLMGAQEVNLRTLNWGPYPLKVVQARLSNGRLLAMGWIGLNSGGYTIVVNYMFPENQKSYTKDIEIWEQFLTQTTAVPLEEHFEELFQRIKDRHSVSQS